jgi:hypothetical protein
MAPTVPHILMTAHGTLPGGELWTCGLRSYKADSFLSAASGNALAVAVANRWRTFRNDATPLFAGLPGSCATIDGATVRELDINGVTVAQYEGIPTVEPTSQLTLAASMPNQCALVVTLVSDRAGRTGKGRIYLPCLAIPVSQFVAGMIVPGQIANFVAPLSTMLNGINTDLATNFGSVLKLAVQSPTSAKAWFDDNSLADYNGSVITSYKIGNRVDIQRRRAASLKEIYTTAPVA